MSDDDATDRRSGYVATPNCPTWIQIGAHSIPRAVGFYRAVLRLQLHDEAAAAAIAGPGRDGDVVHFHFPDSPFSNCLTGGIVKIKGTTEADTLQGRTCGYSNVYFYVEDLEATMAAVEREGGEVFLRRTVTTPGAWHAEFRDTEGNLFGLYTMSPPKA